MSRETQNYFFAQTHKNYTARKQFGDKEKQWLCIVEARFLRIEKTIKYVFLEIISTNP